MGNPLFLAVLPGSPTDFSASDFIGEIGLTVAPDKRCDFSLFCGRSLPHPSTVTGEA